MQSFNLNKEIKRYLTPRKTLAPWIFGKNGQMLPDVREGLLKIANKAALQTVAQIDGIEIADIWLTGSSSGYFYKKDSDIDMQIFVQNRSCPDLVKENDVFNQFAALHEAVLKAKKYRFNFRSRHVDIKISAKHIDFISLYSIKNNKWLITPDPNIAQNLTFEEIETYYLKKKEELLSKIEKINADYTGLLRANRLRDLYFKTYDNRNYKDLVVFKLLKNEGLVNSLFFQRLEAYNLAFCKTPPKEPLRLSLPPL